MVACNEVSLPFSKANIIEYVLTGEDAYKEWCQMAGPYQVTARHGYEMPAGHASAQLADQLGS